METQSAESSHQRCTDSGEKQTCVMHRCAGVRLLFRSHRCFNEGTPDLGIVKLTQKFHLERGGWGGGVPRINSNSCNTPSRSPRLSQMTNRSFSAGFKAISWRGHEHSSPREVKDTALHPTQASYCSSPHFLLSYKNNGAVKMSDLMCVGCFIWNSCNAV